MSAPLRKVPVIDISDLIDERTSIVHTAQLIDMACRDMGFFYISGHGIDPKLQQSLFKVAKDFFLLPLDEKNKIRMSLGGTAWRGYFPVGDELTSGKPDIKEGLYFGQEISSDDSRVKNGTLLHGPNLFPSHPGEM